MCYHSICNFEGEDVEEPINQTHLESQTMLIIRETDEEGGNILMDNNHTVTFVQAFPPPLYEVAIDMPKPGCHTPVHYIVAKDTYTQSDNQVTYSTGTNHSLIQSSDIGVDNANNNVCISQDGNENITCRNSSDQCLQASVPPPSYTEALHIMNNSSNC